MMIAAGVVFMVLVAVGYIAAVIVVGSFIEGDGCRKAVQIVIGVVWFWLPLRCSVFIIFFINL